jgi:kynurenine formamidase
MTIIDLSHTLQNGMPVFPGDSPPEFQKTMTHQNDGAQVIRMNIATHHGTHLDCPLHFVAGGESTESSGVEQFFGNAYLADCSGFKAGETIPASHFEGLDVDWKNITWIVIYTGWYKHWGTEKYFDHFPVLSVHAAKYLVDKGIVGIGLDVISIDAIDSAEYPIHKIVLGNGLYIIENLTGLHNITAEYFNLSAFPLKIKEGDGSPIRAVAITD